MNRSHMPWLVSVLVGTLGVVGCGAAEPRPAPAPPARPIASAAPVLPSCPPGTSQVDGACKVTAPCAKKEEKDCEDKCAAKDAVSCLNAAEIFGALVLDPPPPHTRDVGKAVDRATRACDLGSAEGCGMAGNLVMRRASDLKHDERMKAANALYVRACDGGVVDACVSVSLTTTDPAKVQQALEKGCAAGDKQSPRACGMLGLKLIEGAFGAPDAAKGAELLEKACAADVPTTGLRWCRELGERLASGEGVTKDGAKALAFFEKGCDRGDGKSCVAVGAAYRDGKVTKKDLMKARAALESGCAKGHMSSGPSCTGLGEMLEQGTGGPKDTKKAFESYVRGCNTYAFAPSCARASKMASAGTAGAKDEKAALDFIAKGCRITFADDAREICDKAVAMLEKTDKARITSILEERCEKRHDAHACVKWKALGGAPSEATLTQRVKLTKTRCEGLQDGEACRTWKELGGAPTPEQLKLPALKNARPKGPRGVRPQPGPVDTDDGDDAS